MTVDILETIAKKRDGLKLTNCDWEHVVKDYVHGEIHDFQMAALLMASYIRGLDEEETLALTKAMADSGERIDLSSIPGTKVDKHSTGGVGDKVSLIVVPLVAAAGGRVAKMSGRALGHTGGTTDKLESIPGFRTRLGVEEFVEQVESVGAAISGQTEQVSPADRLIYSLRDMTATVSSPPLIASSVVSKKIAAGADAIVYDVKVGSGAFLKTSEEARILARTLVRLTQNLGRKASAIITDMNQPLGEAVGNALEVEEAIDALKGQGLPDLMEVCFAVASRMLVMGGICATIPEAIAKLDETISSGKAIDKFAEIIRAQGGDDSVIVNPREVLPHANYVDDYTASDNGYIARIDAEKVGRAVLELGAGRKEKDALVDHAVGLLFLHKVGDYVEAGEPIAQLHANDPHKLVATARMLDEAIAFSETPVEVGPVLLESVILP